jgi:hypothetical protein
MIRRGRSRFVGLMVRSGVVGRVTLDPIGDGSSTRLSLVLDFEGHGLGKALVPLARSQTRKQVPKDQQRLRERLEGGV